MLFYLRAAGGFRQLTETSGAAQQDRFAGGAQLVAIRMAEQLGPERVLLGIPVTRIEQAPSRVTVHAAGVAAAFSSSTAILDAACPGDTVTTPWNFNMPVHIPMSTASGVVLSDTP